MSVRRALTGGLAIVVVGAFGLAAARSAWWNHQRRCVKESMGSIRTVATAMESYSIDHAGYPTVDGAGALRSLRALLVPTYVKELPTRDGWDHRLVVKSGPVHYTIMSLGADGRPDEDAPVSRLPGGFTTDWRGDIVFEDGGFKQVYWAGCGK